MNKKLINIFNTFSMLFLILSPLVVFVGRHIKRFCIYNDTEILLQALNSPFANSNVIISILSYAMLGLIVGVLIVFITVFLSKKYPSKFALDNPKYVTRLLGFSIFVFCLCVNHMGLELQFVIKNL